MRGVYDNLGNYWLGSLRGVSIMSMLERGVAKLSISSSPRVLDGVLCQGRAAKKVVAAPFAP